MLASFEDVARLADLEEDDRERITALIEEASDLVEAYCRRSFDPVPEQVRRVVARIVARGVSASGASDAPIGVTQMSATAGPFSRQFTFSDGVSDGGVWLTRQDKLKLGRWTGGAFTIRTY